MEAMMELSGIKIGWKGIDRNQLQIEVSGSDSNQNISRCHGIGTSPDAPARYH